MRKSLFITVLFLNLGLQNAGAKVVQYDDFFVPSKKTYIVRDTIDLQGKMVQLRRGSKIVCKGGILQNGKLVLGVNNKIVGNGSEWYDVSVECIGGRKILIEGITLNFNNAKSINTVVRFVKTSRITLKSINIHDYYHKYESSKETENIDGFKWHVALFYDCIDIKIDSLVIRNSAPEGPFFYSCEKVKLNKLDISDVENKEKRSLWTALHLFYCTDVALSNSTFRKRNEGPNSGSTINACCHNLRIDNCIFEGSKGLDFSNEMKERDFSSENIMMTNSKVLNSFYGIYTGPNPGVLKHLMFTNCEFIVNVSKDREGAVIYGQHIQDLRFNNCHLSGPIVLKIVSEKEYSGLLGDYYFDNCTIDNNCKGKEYILKNRLVYAYNSGIDAGSVYFNNSTINYGTENLCLSSNWGNNLYVIVNGCDIYANQLSLNDGNNKTSVSIKNSRTLLKKPLKKDGVVLLSSEFIHQ